MLPDEEQYAGQLWIAQYLSEPKDARATVQWMKGALTRPWIPDHRYHPTEINIEIIINTVDLTSTQKLTKHSLHVIKEALHHLI